MKGLVEQSGTNEVQTIVTGLNPKFESRDGGKMDL
jgi:hypothetical protein